MEHNLEGFEMFGDCRETVSILYAVIFGADGACIMLSTSSILTAFAAFIFLVVVAQFIARWLWKQLIQPRPTIEADIVEPPIPAPLRQTAPPNNVKPTVRAPYHDDPNYRASAIRPSKR